MHLRVESEPLMVKMPVDRRSRRFQMVLAETNPGLRLRLGGEVLLPHLRQQRYGRQR